MCVCVCVCACVRACVRACVSACVKVMADSSVNLPVGYAVSANFKVLSDLKIPGSQRGNILNANFTFGFNISISFS